MTLAQVLVANVAASFTVAALAGVIVMGRARLCRSFVLYLATTLATNRAVVWWPASFFTPWFWVFKEFLLAALVVGMAMELASEGLMAFPRARRRSQAGVLAVTLVTATALAIERNAGEGHRAHLGSLVGIATAGAVWTVAVVVVVAWWYWIPLGPWHRVIAVGLLLACGVDAVLLSGLRVVGWFAHAEIVALGPAASTATAGIWAAAAWRPARL